MEVGEKITRESRNWLQILVRDVNNAVFRLKQAAVNSVLWEFVEPSFCSTVSSGKTYSFRLFARFFFFF